MVFNFSVVFQLGVFFMLILDCSLFINFGFVSRLCNYNYSLYNIRKTSSRTHVQISLTSFIRNIQTAFTVQYYLAYQNSTLVILQFVIFSKLSSAQETFSVVDDRTSMLVIEAFGRTLQEHISPTQSVNKFKCLCAHEKSLYFQFFANVSVLNLILLLTHPAFSKTYLVWCNQIC